MKQLKLLIVDDQRDEVQSVINQLEATKLIEVSYVDHYEKLGASPREVRRTIKKYDLLVLDILMHSEDSEPFVEFIGIISGMKPFIAYTMLRAGMTVRVGVVDVDVHRFVFGKSGLGVITKDFKKEAQGDPVREEITFNLMEKILWFYWTTR